MSNEKRLRYLAEYDRENTRMFCLKLNRKTDKDVIEALEAVDNKQGYIKALIRADIERGKE